MKRLLFIIAIFFYTLSAQNNYSTQSNWLLDTKTDAQKFKKIQTQFRGFDLAMVEVGYRFNTFYFALQDQNYDLAHYQLDKIKKAIKNGVERREKRQKNSELMFLNKPYQNMKRALHSKDKHAIQKEYLNLKRECNACHHAEKVPFIQVNDPLQRWQPIH